MRQISKIPIRLLLFPWETVIVKNMAQLIRLECAWRKNYARMELKLYYKKLNYKSKKCASLLQTKAAVKTTASIFFAKLFFCSTSSYFVAI